MDLQAGDIIGVGPGDGIGFAINLGTWGWPFRWPACWAGLSHIAFCAHLPDLKTLALWESTTLATTPCLVAGRCKEGVQSHPIDQRIRQWTDAGRAVWRYRLRRPLGPLRQAMLAEFCFEQRDKPYDRLGAFDARDLPIGWFRRCCFGREDLASLFCSEFAAAGLRFVGRWCDENVSGLNPNRFTRRGVRRKILGYPGRLYPDNPEDPFPRLATIQEAA